jgi:hypothetical protein
MEELKSQIEMIDRLIKEARWKEASLAFRPLENRKFPRELLLELSHLARRLSKPLQILKWLHPFVRPEQINIAPATDSEVSLYSIGLSRIGAYREARSLLMGLPQNSAEVQLGLIQLNGFQWRYPEMIRPLKRYMKLVDPQSYPYHIAELNLLTALLYVEKWDELEERAAQLFQTAQQKNYTLLKANALEIYAQSKIHQRDLSKALALLNEAGALLKDSGSRYDVFVKKWKMIIEILSSDKDLRSEIKSLQDQAQKEGGSETVRELDLYYAVARRDEALFHKVYHGTKFPAYRKKIQQRYGKTVPPRINQNFHFEADSRQSDFSEFQPDALGLSSSSLKMLSIILSDFYRPVQLGEVFRDLYPLEYFNPNTSKDRLYKTFSRLKQELQSRSAPIEIAWRGSQIAWRAKENFQLLRGRSTSPNFLQNQTDTGLQERFTVHDFIKTQGLSRRTCERQLDQMVKAGWIKRLRPGLFEKKNKKTA